MSDNIYKEDFVDEETGEIISMTIDLDKHRKYQEED